MYFLILNLVQKDLKIKIYNKIKGISMKKIKVLSIFGTRPEAIKMCPLVKELERHDGIDSAVCVTGQHREMLDSVLEIFNVVPDYDLSIMKDRQTLFDVTTNILNSIKDVYSEVKPDIVLVHGDTSTTYAAALAAFYMGIKIGHVEAGLRTNNIKSPFPEEFNRRSVSLIADLHFAPTQLSYDTLLREGISDDKIFLTGNTAIDALSTTVEKDFTHEYLDWVKDDKLILITAHRRENLGKPMESMFRAINRILSERDDVKALYPIHKNPIVRDTADMIFRDNRKMRIVEPLDVHGFHNLMAKSHFILTDSGGIQEEAPSLGKPVLVMRDTTERPEGIDANTLKLVGTDEETIYNSFKELLDSTELYESMANASNPYGDGQASKYIVENLIKYFIEN